MRVLIALCLAVLLVAPARAEPVRKAYADVAMGAIINETQRIVDTTPEAGNGMHLVWWIPPEYWQVALSQDPTVSDAMREQIVALLADYTMFAVVQADISPLGSMDFYDAAQIGKYLDMKYRRPGGVSQALRPVSTLPADLTMLQMQLRPILAAAMGNLGQNFHFFTVENLAGKDRRLSPWEAGQIEVRLATRKAVPLGPVLFDAPLDSLHVPRRCPNGKPAHISWTYCPWSGKKL